MDTDSFIIKDEDVYKCVGINVEKRFDTSNYEIKRLIPIGKNKNLIGLMKDELSRSIMTEFV